MRTPSVATIGLFCSVSLCLQHFRLCYPVACLDLESLRDHQEHACPEPVDCLQVFVESNTGDQGNELEREFFILRKLIEKERDARFANEKGDPAEFYICTLSNKLIVYKVCDIHSAAPQKRLKVHEEVASGSQLALSGNGRPVCHWMRQH